MHETKTMQANAANSMCENAAAQTRREPLQHPHNNQPATGKHGKRPAFIPGRSPQAAAYQQRTGIKAPRIVAWEITRSCNLSCAHCRAAAEFGSYPGELTFDQMKAVVDDICSISNPIFILTGGEPLMRPDVWDLADYIRAKGGKPVMGTNATLVTPDTARLMHDHGISRISVSLDFPDAKRHDRFRGQAGAFDQTVQGIRNALAAGVEVQVNTTVTRLNYQLVPEMHDLAEKLGAVAFHPFLLVPTGRGESLRDIELSPQQYEDVLRWVYEASKTSPLQLKPTDAPQYCRIARQCAAAEGTTPEKTARGGHPITRGCLGGITFCFISHVGDVQPCGYFDMQVGNVLQQPFSRIWTESPVFNDLRDYSKLKGKCGACEYKGICGGCRARALSATGDYLAQEPYCAYQPRSMAHA